MFRATGIILENSFYTSYNSILFYLQKIPLLGKLLKDRLYRVHRLGKLAVFFGIISEFFWSFIKKFAYYAFIKTILGSILENFDLDLTKSYLLSFMILLSVVGFVKTVDYFSANRDDYIFVKVMRLYPKDYYRSKIYYEIFFNIISYTLVFGLAFRELGFSFIDAFSYSCLLYGLRIFMILAFTKTYKLKEKTRDRLDTILTIIFFGLILVYLIYSIIWLLKGRSLFWQGSITYNRKIFLILGLFFLISSSLALYKTDIIPSVAKKVLRREKFAIDLDEINKKSYELEDKDMEDANLKFGEFESYKGIEYINRIFFSRFKRKFHKSIRIKTFIVLALAIGGNFLISRLSLTDKDSVDYFTYGFCLIGFLAGFLIYIGDKFTRTCFYNMDRFLMKNAYYRSPDLLKDAIKIRFKKMVYFNMPMLIILIFGLMGILYQAKTPWFSYLLTIIFSILGMAFFNFHYLYTYYLIQPFTENMEMKNPLYSILNIFAYYIAIKLMVIVGKFRWLAIGGILIFLFTYIILGFILVTKFSYKRFKLR